MLAKQAARAARDYRAFVGPPEKFDLVGANQFALLMYLGLREHHYLLDVGCGSLRAGRLFIPYLLPDRYFGIEPERWLIEEGLRHELGEDIVRIKRPTFSNDAEFTLGAFGRSFDYILAHSILTHTSAGRLERCISEVRAVMHPRSIFAATYLPGPQRNIRDDWVFAARYPLEYLEDLAGARDLTCRSITWPHPNQQSWVVMVDPSHTDAVAALGRMEPPSSDLAGYTASGHAQRIGRGRNAKRVRAAATYLRRKMRRLRPGPAPATSFQAPGSQ